jgi:hypothetical protein
MNFDFTESTMNSNDFLGNFLGDDLANFSLTAL